MVDTAGRLHIDEELMEEMQPLKELLNPHEILFVADAMTGQDAVNSADEFHKRLGITGVVLTKMDGDARGGAALSIRQVTGQPLKFVGVGEKYDALEPFHPDRMASRILGMGDILSASSRRRRKTRQQEGRGDAAEADETSSRSRTSAISSSRLRKLGRSIHPRHDAPGGHDEEPQDVQVDEKELTRGGDHRLDDAQGARQPQIINGSRRKRIARGSGARCRTSTSSPAVRPGAEDDEEMSSSGQLGKHMGKISGLGKLGRPGF